MSHHPINPHNEHCVRGHGPECVLVEYRDGRETHWTSDGEVWASYPWPATYPLDEEPTAELGRLIPPYPADEDIDPDTMAAVWSIERRVQTARAITMYAFVVSALFNTVMAGGR